VPVRCRAELGLGDDYYQTSAGQRDRLLSATDRLGKTGERIQQGRQQLLETEVRTRALLGGGWNQGCSAARAATAVAVPGRLRRSPTASRWLTPPPP
jgi:hypothetical protein